MTIQLFGLEVCVVQDTFYRCQDYENVKFNKKPAVKQKKGCLEIVRGVNFEIIDTQKDNGAKYLIFFDDSLEEICFSKAYADVATASKHRGLSTIYITLTVLFKSLRCMMQIWTLSAQSGLGSELADWYRDATSVS